MALQIFKLVNSLYLSFFIYIVALKNNLIPRVFHLKFMSLVTYQSKNKRLKGCKSNIGCAMSELVIRMLPSAVRSLKTITLSKGELGWKSNLKPDNLTDINL